jgi:hypothetical protein
MDTTSDLEPVRERLHNFGRWSRDHQARYECGSAESQYRPELLRGDEAEDRSEPDVPVDALDAEHVLDRLSPAHGRLHVPEYLALCARYIHHMDDRELAGYLRRRGHAVPRGDVQALMAQAVSAAARALRR